MGTRVAPQMERPQSADRWCSPVGMHQHLFFLLYLSSAFKRQGPGEPVLLASRCRFLCSAVSICGAARQQVLSLQLPLCSWKRKYLKMWKHFTKISWILKNKQTTPYHWLKIRKPHCCVTQTMLFKVWRIPLTSILFDLQQIWQVEDKHCQGCF